jgi:uncharacterized protein (DUF433 family)
MNWREHIHSDPDILGGMPVFIGTRMSVERILRLIASGWDLAKISYEHPGIEARHIQAAASFAAEMMQDEKFVAISQARAA